MYYNEKIAYERDSQNITQKEMALKLGIKQQQYSRYEKGINVMPVTYLPKICKILNVSADYILGLTDNPKINAKKIRFANLINYDIHYKLCFLVYFFLLLLFL